MKIILIFFLFYSASAFGQNEAINFPNEFKKPNRFHLLSSSDTFDCFERLIILTTDFSFTTIHFSRPHILKDSGHYQLSNDHILVLSTSSRKDTFDIITFEKQTLIVNRKDKQSFIKRYNDRKSELKKTRKTNRSVFREAFLRSLYFDPYSYHRRTEYNKWLVKSQLPD